MPKARGLAGDEGKGRPRENDELYIASYFARAIDANLTIAEAADPGITFVGAKRETAGCEGEDAVRYLNADTLSRRYREISRELEHFANVVQQHIQANARTTWGAPIRFPEGILPKAKPQRGRPRKKRTR